MWYLATQIASLLFIAFAAGLIVGWATSEPASTRKE